MRGEAPPIFLVGFMGSGKSSVGRAISRRTGRAFVDTDAEIVKRAARSIDEIFREEGEGRFRELEWQALQALEGRRDCVVATGGGAFLGRVQRRWMKRSGPTVWLDVPLALARGRVGPGDERPLWLPDDPLRLRALFDRRAACYALAALRVDASRGDADAVARRVLEGLEQIPR